ncbi:MAG: M50 family metallopeptidase [Clostridia bacterium]|nr:M50 family metallopeptidase [Clostridia bacterium]
MKIKIGFFSVMLFLSLLLTHSYFALAAFVAVTLHELGHIFVAKLCKIKFSECKIGIFGAGLTPISSDYSYKNEILLCLGGPVANIICAVVAILVYSFFVNEFTEYFILSSLILALSNLLPIKDFDGGRILYSLLCILKDPYIADRALSAISFVIIFLLWIISVYFLMIASANLSLFIFSLSLFFKLFIKEN